MRLKYETAIATLIQFVTLTILGLSNGVNSVVTTCRDSSGDCVSNLITSLLFFLLTAAWFAFIWITGYAAQNRRSKRLAIILIMAEVATAAIATLNAKDYTDWLSLGTSLIDIFLSLWVITLAYQLIKADGARIVRGQRARKQLGTKQDKK